MYVIVSGNPFDGMHIYGPFNDYYDALNMAQAMMDDRDWWIVGVEDEL